MKIHCDVCSKNHATLFCTADEAALCDACDHRVHHANKLASKHLRFSLHHPSVDQFPLCDVCQEKRAFVFCQQDRAILCKECDFPIHSANEHTKKHSRFLLTGIKLSASAATPSSSPPSNPNNPLEGVVHVPSTVVSEPPNEQGAGFTSSISEYLIETIPGWQVEDFLDSPSLPFAFSKDGGDDYMLAMFEDDNVEGNMGSLSAKSMGGIWVPQAPSSLQTGQQFSLREAKEVNNIKGSSRSRLTGDDNNFIVPQMRPASFKRPRLLW